MSVRLGYCVFTFEGGDWIRDDFAGLEQGFAQAKRLGFDCVEVPSLLVRSRPRTDHEFTRRMARLLDLSARYELPLSGIFASVELVDEAGLQDEIDEILVLARIASTAGITALPMTIGMDRTGLGLDTTVRLAGVVSRIADATAAFGVRVSVHPHIDTPVETPDQIDAFYAAASPAVGMCLDTGHVLAGGGDPRAVLGRHRSRVDTVHLKDLDLAAFRAATGEDRYAAFRDPGEGDADLRSFTADLLAGGFAGTVLVENDYTPTPVESMEQARRFLAETVEGVR